MVLLIPYDGSELSRSALLHAARASPLYEETPLAVTVIPDQNAAYARENGWIDESEGFDRSLVVSRLREQVAEIAPEADFEYIFVDRAAPSGTISNRIRDFARKRETSAIFVGSENAGHRMIGLDSVGGRVVSEGAYDIAIIRNPLPAIEEEGEDS